MIPCSVEEMAGYDYDALTIVIPEHLTHSLIGEPIEGTSYFKSFPEDPTKAGYTAVAPGTPMERKVYKTRHQPTGSTVWYRKLNSLVYGDVWEIDPT